MTRQIQYVKYVPGMNVCLTSAIEVPNFPPYKIGQNIFLNVENASDFSKVIGEINGIEWDLQVFYSYDEQGILINKAETLELMTVYILEEE